MAGVFTAVDLSKLPFPGAVETLDYESILAAMLADLRAKDPTFTALVESDPAYAVLEVAAYREVLVRQRANESVTATMLAYALGNDLDQIGANYGVYRLVLDPGDATALPPVPATYETDTDFRRRIQLSFEGYTTAGSEGSYIFHGLSADADVKDIAALSPTPGVVNVYVLSKVGNGAASPGLVANVDAALNGKEVRPLTDNVTTFPADIVNYTIQANITVFSGPDIDVVREAALAAAQVYVDERHGFGLGASISGIYAALHQAGVKSVELISPSADVPAAANQAAFCTGINLTLGA